MGEPDAPTSLAGIGAERVKQLRKMATAAEVVRWSVPAVLRENASLILTMAARIEELERERDEAREQATENA